MKKIIKIFILVTMIVTIAGCKSQTKNDNDSKDNQTKISIKDIDWKVKQGIVDGKRYAILNYKNNSSYTITHFELTFTEKDNLKEEDKDKYYNYLIETFDASDDDISELKDEKISFTVESDRIVDKNKSVKNQRFRHYEGIFYLQDASYLNLTTPDTAIIEYIDKGKIHTINYDFHSNEYTEEETTEDAIYWTKGSLKDKLPKPKAKVIKNDYSDDDEEFSFDACGLTKDDYDKYIEECKKMGYTVDVDSDSDSFLAKNTEGYQIDIDYDEDEYEMSVTISAPGQDNDDEDNSDIDDEDNVDDEIEEE